VSGPAIETARRGRYTANAFREDGARWNFLLDKYIEREGQDFSVSPRIREKVRFYPHNILEGFNGSYDIIFFRNSLIYFTPQNRLTIMGKIAEALYNGGILVMGTSETSSLDHPLLGSRCSMNTFYFEKLPAASVPQEKPRAVLSGKVPGKGPSPSPAKPARPSLPPRTRREGAAEIAKLAAQMEMEEGRAVTEKVMEFLREGRGGAEEGPRENELIAGVLYFLGREDYDSASGILVFLERGHNSAVISFLRGEYHYLTNSADKAEAGYTAAAGKDPAFWPAFYRISSLAAEGNPARYEYKIKKALESLALGREKGYEIFIGGFSPDYYRRILEKRLDGLRKPQGAV
jgi:chemotaxis protein methyltransferase CheR